MNSEDIKSINEALQAIYKSKSDSYLTLSTVINDQLKIILEKFPQKNTSFCNIDMLKLKEKEKEKNNIKQFCIDNVNKLKDKIDKIELQTKLDKSQS